MRYQLGKETTTRIPSFGMGYPMLRMGGGAITLVPFSVIGFRDWNYLFGQLGGKQEWTTPEQRNMLKKAAAYRRDAVAKKLANQVVQFICA